MLNIVTWVVLFIYNIIHNKCINTGVSGNMIKKIIITICVVFVTNVAVIAYDSEELTYINIYEKLNPAIVSIDAELPIGISSGTGCIIDKSGIILTSSHVIENSKNIVVTLYNGHVYKGKILKVSSKDIALIAITSKENLDVISLGDSENIKVGQKVMAIGNPFGLSGTFTQGIISRIDYAKNKIQTDAAINPGNSGGPLITTSGEVVGINQSIYNPDNNISNIGIGFAIPINIVKEVIKKTSR